MTKILIICTGNSCRSQMAVGFLKSFDSSIEVYSAGTFPAKHVSPVAVKVMNEIGIDISNYEPESLDQFLDMDFDYVVTVCDHAKETCPVFTGNVKHRLHIGFDDPYQAKGTEEEVLSIYKKVRDQIKTEFYNFYQNLLNN